MKRSLTLLLASLFLVCVLTACGGEKEQNGDQNDSTTTDTNNAGSSDNTGGGSENGTTNGETGTAGGENGSPITGGASNNGTADNGTVGTGDDLLDDAEDALDDAGDALTGNDGAAGRARAGGASYQQMLRNAQVHDRDGYLNDRENSVTPGAAL